MGLTGADTGLEGRCWGPLEKKPLEGLPEPKGLSTCRQTRQTDGQVRSLRAREDLSLSCLPSHCPPSSSCCHDTRPEKQPHAQRRPRGRTRPRDDPPTGRAAASRSPLASTQFSGRVFWRWGRTATQPRRLETRHLPPSSYLQPCLLAFTPQDLVPVLLEV